MNENRNIFLLFFLTMGIFWAYEYFMPSPHTPIEQVADNTIQKENKDSIQKPRAGILVKREDAIEQTPRVQIDTPEFEGSINLTGGVLDDLRMKKHREAIDSNKPVVLLSPFNTEKSSLVQFGWKSTAKSKVADLPTHDTTWVTSASVLTPQSPVTLTYTNKEGITFERTISIDDKQLFTVTERIINNTNTPIKLMPYGRILHTERYNHEPFSDTYEGVVGYLGQKFKSISYDDLKTSEGFAVTTDQGWIGANQKYWINFLAPRGDAPFKARAFYKDLDRELYCMDLIGNPMDIQAGGDNSYSLVLFSGAKSLNLLDHYSKKYNILNADMAVDFGWLYYITKPTYILLTFLIKHLHHVGLSILALTVLIKLALFPLVRKQFYAMKKMSALQPEMERLKKLYPDDKVKYNQALMETYRKNKVNPAGGCLPLLVQAPILFALYKVLSISIEMRHAPFWGWIHDLSAPDPTSIFNLFGLIPWTPPAFLMIGAWPIIMGLTMWIQQRMTPAAPNADPSTQKAMQFLPLFLTYIMSGFPAGLVIYWTWNNILTIIQQKVIHSWTPSTKTS